MNSKSKQKLQYYQLNPNTVAPMKLQSSPGCSFDTVQG